MRRLDAWRLFAEVLADPAAYGFANTTARACGATPSLLCGPSSYVAPNANRTYMFADDVHPTGAGFEVIAGADGDVRSGHRVHHGHRDGRQGRRRIVRRDGGDPGAALIQVLLSLGFRFRFCTTRS